MPILSKTAFGTVTGVWGVAMIRQPDGKLRAVKVGDQIKQGDVILTSQDGIVQIDAGEGKSRLARAESPLDKIIEAVESGEEAPAAGAGGGDGSLLDGMRVARISEPLSPLEVREQLGFVPQVGGDVTSADAAGRAMRTPPLQEQPDPEPQPQPEPQPDPQPEPQPEPEPEPQPEAEDVTPPMVTTTAPALTNDATPPITGTTDLPPGSTVTLTITDANGSTQVVTAEVQPDGTYATQPAQPLPDGAYTVVATATDPAGNTATDNAGGVVDASISASIALDAVTADNILDGTEAAGTVTLTGTVGGDVMPGAMVTLTVGGQTHTGTVAADRSFSIDVPGSTLANAASTTVVASVGASDAAGNATTATTSRDYGVNQPPTANPAAADVNEDATLAAAVDASDPDAGDSVTVLGVAVGSLPSASGQVGVPIAGVWGTLTLQADGSYTYVPLPAAQQLVTGQTVDELFTYTVADSFGDSATATLTIRVIGADDPAVISGGIDGTVTEDGVTIATGQFTIVDPDANQAAFVPATLAGSHGTFAIDAAGAWTYTLDNAAAHVQGLRDGQTVVESFTIASADGTPRTVSVTVHGTPDAPQIGAGSGAVTEDTNVDGAGRLTTGGTLSIADADAGESAFQPQGTPGLYGSFVLAAAGAWTYAADNAQAAIQQLGAGDTLTESFTVMSVDGTLGSVVVAIHGINDAPAALSSSFTVAEDAPVVSGAVIATDVDHGAALAYALDFAPPAGLAFGSDGTYGFDPSHAAYQSLGVGQSVVLIVPYTVTDEHGATSAGTLTVTVTGTNDAPVAQAASFATQKDAPLVQGAVSATDVDANAALSFALDGAPPAGLSFQANGTYTFDPTHIAYQSLGVGQSVVLSVPYTVTDDQGATSGAVLTITVLGTNFAPVVGSASVSLSEEGLASANPDTLGSPDTTDAAIATGTLALSDADGQPLSVTLTAPLATLTSAGVALGWTLSNGGHTLTGSAGGVPIVVATIDDAGHYSVALTGPLDHAAAGGENTLSFAIGVQVFDGQASAAGSIGVTVQDDAPLLAAPMAGIVVNGAGSGVVGDLQLDMGADAGSTAQVMFGGTTDASGFIVASHVNPAGATVATHQHLTYNGSKLTYTTAADGTLTAVDSQGTAVFTVALDAAAGRYAVTMLQALDRVGLTAASFGAITAGNNDLYHLADTTNTFRMTLSGFAANGTPSTVNTSSGAIGVANNSMESNERLHFDFTSSTVEVTGISITAQGLGTGESLTWKAYDANGMQIGAGTLAGSGNNNTSKSLTLDTDDVGGQMYAAIEFGAGANTSYKLVLNALNGESRILNQVIDLQAQATDADGDATAAQHFSLAFAPTATVAGTSAGEALGGSSGNDILSGGSGNDLLWGGAGDDTLSGGAGSDVFAWRLGDAGQPGMPAHDTVADFDANAGGDVLDLRDLLAGDNPADLANYLHFESAPGGTTVAISSTGGFSDGYSSAAVDQVITLQNVDLVGSFGSDADVINDLITRGKLLTDPTA
jgi:VCBS repeat-containing protein